MSAWIVDRTHIDLLLKVGLVGPRGREVRPSNAWHSLSWFAEEMDGSATLNDYQRLRRELRYDTADEVGRMLWTENVRSVTYRYPDDTPSTRPGPASEDIDAEAEMYVYTDPGYVPTVVEACSAICCFEYQSCEHPGWRKSEALRFCDALRHSLMHALPGWEKAPWGWDSEKIAEARARLLTGVRNR